MTWLAWLNLLGYPVVLSLLVSACTAWSVRRSVQPRLEAIESALADLAAQQRASDSWSGQVVAASDLLEQDPHARYRRPGAP